MSKVKGGKLDSFELQAQKPVKVWLIRLLILLILVLGSASAFYYGYAKGETDEAQAQKNIAVLAEVILTKTTQYAQLNQQYTKLQEQYSHLELAAQIDASQVEVFRLKEVAHFDEINELEAQLTFYQSIMSPSDIKKGLTIEQFEIVGPNTLKAILTQVSDKPSKIEGAFEVLITGLLNGKTKVYNLSKVSTSSASVRFGFKYFQRFSFDLTFPEDFKPQVVELIAKEAGNKNKKISKIISWPSAN